MATSGYEEIHEETVRYENGKPVRHVKIVKRDLSPEEAEQLVERDRKVWADFDAAFQDFDSAFKMFDKPSAPLGFPFNSMKAMFASMREAFGRLRETLRNRRGGSDGK